MLEAILEEVNEFEDGMGTDKPSGDANVKDVAPGKTLKGVIAEMEPEDGEDEIEEKKMSADAKKKAAKAAKSPEAKKAKKLKVKCMDKYGDKVRKSNGKLTCKSDGTVGKGMDKSTKKAMAKARNKH